MMVNIHPLGLDKKYGTSVKIDTISWQDTLPTLASASGDVDIGFASLAEFLAKEENLNKGSSDPLLFIYPAYVFKGEPSLPSGKILLLSTETATTTNRHSNVS